MAITVRDLQESMGFVFVGEACAAGFPVMHMCGGPGAPGTRLWVTLQGC